MKSNRATALPYSIIESNEIAEVWQDKKSGEFSLHAVRSCRPRQIITAFKASAVLSKPTYLTVQTGIDTHITLAPTFLQYANHSCAPNAFFDTTRMQFIALKAIEPGDEITFFYPSTEWNMQQPFICHCNQNQCLGSIRGAAYLSPALLKNYRLTDFIAEQISQQSSLAS